MRDAPPTFQGEYRAAQAPHRATLVLVFGILGLTACGPMGIVAWILGAGDLRRMRQGTMDPSGEGMTRAGMICGIISTVLQALGLLLTFAWVMLFLVIGLGAAASGP